MEVLNVHERELKAAPERVGVLIDSLSSSSDALWPWHSWPRMGFDRPLAIGAAGGHGPIRYFVEDYVPGQSIKFRFTGPKGFDGFHSFQISSAPGESVILKHTIQMTARGPAILSWPVIFRPLHDALLEDCLAQAQASLGHPPLIQLWPPWVKFLRWVVSGGKTLPQIKPRMVK